eukprot:gene10787-22518_t
MTSTESEARPVPKVPSTAWRWPAAWPFPEDYLQVVEPKTGEDGGFLDDARSKVEEHLGIFTDRESTVLEISCDKSSLLPSSLKTDKTSFVALTKDALVDENSRVFIDLNAENPILPWKSNTFSSVVLSNGIESLVRPTDAFREIWRVLKPEGTCFICFSSKPYRDNATPVKMWTTFTDEQKIWISGSYYQYSAGLKFEKAKDSENLSHAFVVQANKLLPPSIEENAQGYIEAIMNGVKHMETDDKTYIALRLTTELSRVTKDSSLLSTADKEALVEKWLLNLQGIYEILKDVKEVVIPKPVKAMLASFILTEWSGSQAQKLALRRGVGLDPADDIFWNPVASATSALGPRDKIILLSDVLPLFKDQTAMDVESETGPYAAPVPQLLLQLVAALQSVCTRLPALDIELLATELLASDYVQPLMKASVTSAPADASSLAQSTANRLINFVKGSNAQELTAILNDRKTALVAPPASSASPSA